jgi:hypothetical protein
MAEISPGPGGSSNRANPDYANQYRSNVTGAPFRKSKWGDIYYTTPGDAMADIPGHNFASNPHAMVGEYMGRSGIKFNSHWNDILDNLVTGGLPGYLNMLGESAPDPNNIADWAHNFIAGGMGTPGTEAEGPGWMDDNALAAMLQGLQEGSTRSDAFNNWADSAQDREIIDLLTLLGTQGVNAGQINSFIHGLNNKMRDYSRYQGAADPNQNQGSVTNLFDFILDSGLLHAYGLM